MLHFHQHHDALPCDDDHDWPEYAHAILATLFHLEATFMTQQDQLNTDVAAIGDALTSIASEITDLKAQLANQVPDSVDLSGLDALAQRARDLVPASTSTDAPAADATSTDPAETTPAPNLDV
jgi:hypothetical protein